ncbi:MAG TPA: hypothetical protein VKV35_03595 [Streptosporangiaceae bacterium]|nr:hypothetical protein [Streptosporangiaceae bacterium]
MGKVIADITMSLDGFITGPNDGPGRGLGERGECLHNWVMGRAWRYDDEGPRFAPLGADRTVLEEAMGSIGAGIIGRRMFDVTGGWGGNPPGGTDARYFVLTHSVPQQWAGPGSPFTFVTDGIGSALAQAKAAAGGQERRHRRRCQRHPAVPGRRARGRTAAAPRAGAARRRQAAVRLPRPDDRAGPDQRHRGSACDPHGLRRPPLARRQGCHNEAARCASL